MMMTLGTAVLSTALMATPLPAAELQQEVDAVVAAGATSATVEVSGDGRPARASSGPAVAGTNWPVPQNARFRIGSETKTFLATVVLQLVDEGRLSLDDKVERVLPGVVHDDRITVRQLLNHSSGLYEVLATMPSPRSEEFLAIRWKTWTTAELVARATAYPVVFTPGTEVRYNNTGYLVLGLIVEKLTGHSYADEIKHRIIQPLQLKSTSLPGTNPFIFGPHARGYLPLERGLVDITEVNPSILNAAGEMISTTRDLNRFFQALLGGELLPAHLMQELKTTAHGSQYGLGVISRGVPCGTAWGKDGDAPGYSTWTFVSPTNHRSVTVSVTWGAGNHKAAVNALLDKELCR
ncbi:serine hydrolase domain-containing protein [Kribbella italica]|uniref:D-alanyl-D-alanine carboxypeptidase n=1 Tax=Kribbella italica TaxID=1540520 RepID=A0A7W9J4A2_9ACTN|nr:serine hydrolase domain-containing protein [Kribbella italica]MBB5834880.1 D-alanyl-D-alanine carboxypeptidase [Kribbella italica]